MDRTLVLVRYRDMSYCLLDTVFYPANAPNDSRHEPSDPPGDWLRSTCRRPANASRLPIPTHPTRLPHSSVGPCAQPWTARWHIQDLAAAWWTCSQALLPPPSARVRLPGHPSGHCSRRSVPRADTRQWLADRRTWRNRRPSRRPEVPVQSDTLADGHGRDRTCERPEVDTASAERPTMRLVACQF